MKKITLLAILLLATGCAPLSQAPLVYNSKTIFGGRISVTNPQTPGADINVGLTTEDSAFVPVAVAKLPAKLGGDGGESKIELIKGTYAGSMNPATVDAAVKALQDAEATLTQKSATLTEKQKQSDTNKAEKAAYEDLKNKQEALKKEINNSASISPIQLEQKRTDTESIQRQLDSIWKKHGSTALEAENVMSDQTAQLSADLTQAQTEKDSAEANVKKAAAELAKVEGKTDAYSVFGSFDSWTSVVNGGNNGVTLGKMFSTGVAAQNISQGLQQSRCLATLKTIVSGTITAENAEKICGK